jgi:cell shape-determining protein MreD
MEIKEQAKEPLLSSKTVGRCLLFGVFLFLTAACQVSFFSATAVFPATPDLLLAAVMGLAVCDGERTGAVSGIAAGVFSEALGGTGIMLMPVFYMLAGYVFGIVTRFFLNRNFLSWIVYMLIAAFARSVWSLLYLAAIETGFNFLTVFSKIITPEFLMTVIFSLPMYFLCRLCAKPFHRKSEME